MKKILFILVVICFAYNSYCQNNVGIGTASPDPSAVLELKSTSQGLLVPRTSAPLLSPLRQSDCAIFEYGYQLLCAIQRY
jgi:hypothetical protein